MEKVKPKDSVVNTQLQILGTSYFTFIKLASNVHYSVATDYNDVVSIASAVGEALDVSTDYKDLNYILMDINGRRLCVAEEWLDMTTLSSAIAYDISMAGVPDSVKLEIEALAKRNNIEIAIQVV